MDNQNQRHSPVITVFYDGACGLCAREINHYKKIAPRGVFKWVDITKDTALFESLGHTQADGLRALHAQDSGGIMHIGVDAFILIWAQLPRWRVLSKFASLPGIHFIAAFLYKHFANWRFKKLGYGTCRTNQD